MAAWAEGPAGLADPATVEQAPTITVGVVRQGQVTLVNSQALQISARAKVVLMAKRGS